MHPALPFPAQHHHFLFNELNVEYLIAHKNNDNMIAYGNGIHCLSVCLSVCLSINDFIHIAVFSSLHSTPLLNLNALQCTAFHISSTKVGQFLWRWEKKFLYPVCRSWHRPDCPSLLMGYSAMLVAEERSPPSKRIFNQQQISTLLMLLYSRLLSPIHSTPLDFTRPHFIPLHSTPLHFTSFHFTRPHFTSLYCTKSNDTSLLKY